MMDTWIRLITVLFVVWTLLGVLWGVHYKWDILNIHKHYKLPTIIIGGFGWWMFWIFGQIEERKKPKEESIFRPRKKI